MYHIIVNPTGGKGKSLKALGKVEIVDVLILHDDVVDGGKVERIIDILQEVKYEDLDVVFVFESGAHTPPPFARFLF